MNSSTLQSRLSGLTPLLELTLLAVLVATAPILAQPTNSSSSSTANLSEEDSALFNGAVVHTVPLELPSARGGLVPTLSVVANHQIADGPLGVGWGLNGLSRIERRSSTLGVPSFASPDTDTFWMDGELLVWNIDHYSLEHDDNRWFSSVYDSYGSLIAWQAKRDGWTWTWGVNGTTYLTDPAAVEAWDDTPGTKCGSATHRVLVSPAHPVTWLLSSIKDPHGNEITYKYDGNCCSTVSESALPDDEYAYQHKLVQITYGNGDINIHFDYKARRDPRASASLGRLRLLDCRLDQIRVEVGSGSSTATYSKYDFTYVDEENTKDGPKACNGEVLSAAYTTALADLTLLYQIDRIATDNSCKMLRRMEYNSDATSFPDADAGDPPTNTMDLPDNPRTVAHIFSPQVVNFDGDAWSDLAILSTKSVKNPKDPNLTIEVYNYTAYRNIRSSAKWNDGSSAFFETDTGLNTFLSTAIGSLPADDTTGLQFLDIDRDGATEVLVNNGTDTIVYEYEATTGASKSHTDDWARVDAKYLQYGQVADVDGDGFPDLVIPPSPDIDTIGWTRWIRNTGGNPADSSDARYLDNDKIVKLVTPLEDTTSEARKDFDKAVTDAKKALANCDYAGTAPTPIPVRGTCIGQTSYTDDAEYHAAQARWGDFNNDGIADVAYALYLCWDGDTSGTACSGTNCVGLGGCPNGDYVYSHIFYGDGRGGFHDTGGGAGPPFMKCRETTSMDSGWDPDQENTYWAKVVGGGTDTWRTTDGWGAIDLDRSGHLSLIHQHYDPLRGMQLWASPDVGLPSVFSLDDTFASNPSSHTASVPPFETQLPGHALVDLWAPPHYQLLADWNGDGFTDVLRVYESAKVPEDETAAQLDSKMEFYANQRTVARGRLKSIQTAWGTPTVGHEGKINYKYQFTTNASNPNSSSCPNTGSPYVEEVINSVTDETGTRTYWFGNGQFDTGRNRPMGFGDVFITYHSGEKDAHNTHLTFSTRTADSASGELGLQIDRSALGSLLSQAKYDASGNLEFFSVYRYYSGSYGDTVPPYFNPLQGECDFWLPGTGDPAALQKTCCDSLTAFAGLTHCDPYSTCNEAPSLVQPGFAGNYGSLPAGLIEPDKATLKVSPAAPPALASGYQLMSQEWQYDSDQRLILHYDHRDTSIAEDDIKTTHSWGVWNTHAGKVSDYAGKELNDVSRYDGAGYQLSHEIRSDFGDFNQPKTVTEAIPTPTPTAICINQTSERKTKYEYANGDITKVTDPEGNITTYAYNDGGLLTRKVDAVGRVETINYGPAFRETSRSFQELTVSTLSRDGFGRVTKKKTDFGEGAPPVTETWSYDDDVTDITEPRAGVRYDDGSAWLEYLDQWGRKVVEENGTATGGATGMPSIDSTTKVSKAQGYDTDGNLRFVTRPYATGDKIAATWSYADEFARTSVVLTPGHVLPASATSTTFNKSRYWYQPKLTIEIDPMGYTTTTSFDTMNMTRSKEGHLRLAEQYDVLGNVIRSTDGDGVSMVTTYDPFYRPCTRYYDNEITLYDKSKAKPTWKYEYDLLDRLQVSTDPEGNETDWDYDGIGRALQKSFKEHGTTTPIVVQKSVYADYTGPKSRRVTTTDVNGNSSTMFLDGGERTTKVQLPKSPTDKVTQETRTYDNRARLATVMDIDGLTHRYYYDVHDRLDHEVGPAVASDIDLTKDPLVDPDFDPDTTWIRYFDYDAAGDLTKKTDRDGVETVFTPYWSGKQATITRSNPEGGTWTLGSWTYRKDGLPVQTLEKGVANTYVYDALGRKTNACIGASGGSCGLSLGWNWTEADRLKTEIQGGTFATQHFYNGVGWPYQTTHPDASTETWDYDIMGRTRRHTDEENVVSEVDFDGWGRETKERLPGMAQKSYAYTFGVVDPYFGRVEDHTLTESDGGIWKSLYDYAGRTVQANRSDLTTGRYTYEGSHLMNVADGTVGPPFKSLARTVLAYDSNGQRTMRWGPLAESRYSKVKNPVAGTDYFFNYTWTPEDRQLSIEGPNDKTRYTWDNGALTLEEISGVTNKAYAYYDDYPRTKTITTGTAAPYRTQTFEWERGLWLSKETATDGSTTRTNTFTSRDAYGTALSSESKLGKLSQVGYTLKTDSRGRVTSKASTYKGSPFLTIVSQYYKNSYTKQVDVSGTGFPMTSLIYDRRLDRFDSGFVLRTITSSTGAVVNLMGPGGFPARDPLGRPDRIEVPPDGKVINYIYDKRGRVTSQTVTDNPGTTILTSRASTYDNRDRMKSLSVTDSAGTTTLNNYQYQEPGWLTNEDRAVGAEHENLTYKYDAAGNLTTKTSSTSSGTTSIPLTYTYGNRLDTFNGNSVSWDDKGGMTEDYTGQHLSYDPKGEPAQVEDLSKGSSFYSFVRDPSGLPVGEVISGTPGGERKQVWGNVGGGSWPLAGISATGKPILWVVADDILAGRIEDGVPHGIAVDQKGSLLMFDNIFLQDAGAFGDAAEADPSVTERDLYAALEDVNGTYMSAQHRLYDPVTGLFTSKDPIGQPDGELRFAYANRNPLTQADPAGLCVSLSINSISRSPIAYIQGPGGGPAMPSGASTYVGPGYGAPSSTEIDMAKQKDAAVTAAIDEAVEAAGGDPNKIETGGIVVVGGSFFEKQPDGSWVKTGEMATVAPTGAAGGGGGGGRDYAFASLGGDVDPSNAGDPALTPFDFQYAPIVGWKNSSRDRNIKNLSEQPGVGDTPILVAADPSATTKQNISESPSAPAFSSSRTPRESSLDHARSGGYVTLPGGYEVTRDPATGRITFQSRLSGRQVVWNSNGTRYSREPGPAGSNNVFTFEDPEFEQKMMEYENLSVTAKSDGTAVLHLDVGPAEVGIDTTGKVEIKKSEGPISISWDSSGAVSVKGEIEHAGVTGSLKLKISGEGEVQFVPAVEAAGFEVSQPISVDTLKAEEKIETYLSGRPTYAPN